MNINKISPLLSPVNWALQFFLNIYTKVKLKSEKKSIQIKKLYYFHIIIYYLVYSKIEK